MSGNRSAHRSARGGTSTAVVDPLALVDAIVNSTAEMMWSVEADSYRMLWCNQALRDYFVLHRGVDIEPGMLPGEIYPDPTFVATWEQLYRTTLDRGSWVTEYHGQAGTAVLQLSLNTLFRDGEPFAISVFAKDISEQHRALLALAESEAKYRSVVMSMAEGVVFQNAAGEVIEVNPAAAKIEGRGDEEMVGHTSDDPQWGAVYPDGRPFPGHEHPSMVTLRTGEPQSNVVMGIHRPNGELRWISINSAPVVHEDGGTPTAVVATFHDVTDRKRVEDELAAYVRQLETSMWDTLRAVASMVELRDPYTAGHMQRVGSIARALGMELGWCDRRCDSLEMAGMVHDVGKIAVPSELLTKPTSLSPLEAELIKSHAQWSYEILKNVHFPLPIADIVRQHHERLDGSGYPMQLRDAEILPEARVLAVADVLESMAAHRPYRPALGLAAAMAELQSQRGVRFDADVVDALERLVRNGYELPAPAPGLRL